MSGTASPYAGGLGLQASEVRVLGCLLEKQRTTPDAYPLSLNALRLACNQSTNRDPVVEYDDAVIRDALHRLERRGYARLASGAGSRAPKYRHLLAEALPMGSSEQAIMCTLMLRGAQTPGELKQRSERMHQFAELAAVLQTLTGLIESGLVERLARRPGHKEERYAQTLEGREEHADDSAPAPHAERAPGLAADGGVELRQGVGADALEPERPSRRVAEGAADASALGQALGQLSERLSRLEREVSLLRQALSEREQELAR